MNSAHNLGVYLRRRRERSGLSVEAVSVRSRIVPRLVDAPALGERGRVVRDLILLFGGRP